MARKRQTPGARAQPSAPSRRTISRKAVLPIFGGSLRDADDWATPFFAHVTPELVARGFETNVSMFDLPPELRPQESVPQQYRAGVDFSQVPTVILGIGLFLGTELAKWSVKQVLDEVYEPCV
jgi:hypothetical protein